MPGVARTTTAARARRRRPRPVGEGEGALSIVAWAGYIEDGSSDKAYDWVTPFEKDTGCKVSVKTAGTSDEMVSLMTGSKTYDLVTASGDASLRLIQGGTVQPVNLDLIPGYENVDERLQDAPWYTVDGKSYGVPYQWGGNVLDVQHRGLQDAARLVGRRVRGAGPARRQVERGPGAGVRRRDLHRRRRALPEGARSPISASTTRTR